MSNSKQSGFTLIELLVVVALIGIFSSIFLASLNDARNDAKDAAIKQQVKSLATMMELNYNTSGDYSGGAKRWISLTPSVTLASTNCAGQTWTGPQAENLKKTCQNIEDNIGHQGDWGGAYMYWGTPLIFPWWPSSMTNNTGEYAFAVLLNSGDWFCVGSGGSTYTGAQSMWWFTANGCPTHP